MTAPSSSPHQPAANPKKIVGCLGAFLIVIGLFVLAFVLSIIGSLVTPTSSDSKSQSSSNRESSEGEKPSGTEQRVWEDHFDTGYTSGTLRYFVVEDGVAKMEVRVAGKDIGLENVDVGKVYGREIAHAIGSIGTDVKPSTYFLGEYLCGAIYRKVTKDPSITRVELSVTATYPDSTYEDKYGHEHTEPGLTKQGTVIITDVDEIRRYTTQDRYESDQLNDLAWKVYRAVWPNS